MKVLPLLKGGDNKVLAMLKGGHKKFWVVLTQELEVFTIMKSGAGGGGGAKSFHPVEWRGGGQKVLPIK